MKSWTLAACLLLALAVSAATADIVHLKNGGRLEGIILEDGGGRIRIRTRAGVVTVKRSEVLRIEKKGTPLEEFEERLGKLAPDDAEGHYRLALFCRENGLKKQERELLDRTLEIDDQHEEANRAAGNVCHDGWWMTPAARDRLLSDAEDAGKRAQGLVKYKGEWVTPEDKANLEKGLVKYDGRWMTPDEVKEAQGFVKYKDGWVRKDELERRTLVDTYKEMLELDVEVALSEHFAAIGPFDRAVLESICDVGEQTLTQFRSIMRVEPSENLFRGREEDEGQDRCHIVYSKQQFDYVRIVEGMQRRYPKDIPAARARLMKQQKGFYFVYPACYVMGYQYPSPIEQVRGAVAHKTSHVLLMRYKYASGFYPWWLLEGLGTYQEVELLGRCDTYCITETGYEAQEGDPGQKWAGLARWKQIVKSQVLASADRGLIRLSSMGLNELDYRDLTKSWSVCEWMISLHPEAFVKMVELIKQKASFVDVMMGAFGKSPEAVDRDWRKYVRDNY